MSKESDRNWVVERAKTLGFDLCGVAHAQIFPELERFPEWLQQGYAGEMRYLEDPRRQDPSSVLHDVRSVIVCGLNYNTDQPYSTQAAASNDAHAGPPRGWISRYAWGDDYHEVMWSKLNALALELRKRFVEPFTVRTYADTGPVAERVLAKYAGLGWLGKNTLLLNAAHGSWLFLGVILTSLQLEPSLGAADLPSPDLCGQCRQCLDACPTGALVEPYLLDARRCISYLTIELRGAIPEEFRNAMGWHVYGCDICQDVCPYNRGAPASTWKEFQPRGAGTEKSLFQAPLEWLASLTENGFRQTFQRSAMKRTKWAGLIRNACIALANQCAQMQGVDRERVIETLTRLAESKNSVVAESARWALGRIQQERI